MFDEDGEQQQEKESNPDLTKKKISLFDDDDDDANEPENSELISNFKLKLRFEGETGKKVIIIQK